VDGFQPCYFKTKKADRPPASSLFTPVIDMNSSFTMSPPAGHAPAPDGKNHVLRVLDPVLPFYRIHVHFLKSFVSTSLDHYLLLNQVTVIVNLVICINMYVPLPYITHLTDSCGFSQTYLICGRSISITVHTFIYYTV
jgi:hypothetical protein